MSELQGKAAVVTGASRGIGAATAEELARQGVAVVLAARSTGEIDAVARRSQRPAARRAPSPAM
jgi:NADP-dependent 3-hydroxy acid dehydrogenase YdfG